MHENRCNSSRHKTTWLTRSQEWVDNHCSVGKRCSCAHLVLCGGLESGVGVLAWCPYDDQAGRKAAGWKVVRRLGRFGSATRPGRAEQCTSLTMRARRVWDGTIPG